MIAVVAAAAIAAFLIAGRDGAPPPAPAVAVPLPSAIAALGDSITAGVGAAPDEFAATPEHAWATGDADDDVSSHYERLVAADAPIDGRNHNYAFSGANMSDGPEQARRAVAARASYVTIFLGSNDVCTSSADTMTPVASFERDFRATVDVLTRGLPDARLFVISIPDIHRLWQAFGDDAIAPRIWDAAGTCGAMLDPSNTEAQRDAARDRNLAFNEVLERVCAQQDRCRFDNNAIYNYDFGRDLVAVDFFHPSHRGHEVLADVTWEYGYWPDL